MRQQPAFEIVAIVTSAGGLEALSRILRDLPPDLSVPIVISQHLGRASSGLVKLLRRTSPMPISWAQPGSRPVPGTVTVCPVRAALEIFPDRTCSLRAIDGAHDRPLDALLESVAETYGSAALGIVLTGMGSDGSAGVRALKRAGSTVIAQSEDTAEHPSMPRAAAEAGADLVLPLYEIGPVTVDVVRGAPLPRSHGEAEAIADTFGEPGEIAKTARELDWKTTLVGPVATWSPVLRSIVRMAMDSPHPTLVMWGPEYAYFQNEMAIQPLGKARAAMLARPCAQVLPEIWADIRPLYERVMRGEPVVQRAFPLVMQRSERLEDRWFNFTLTPVREGKRVCGIQAVFVESTAEVLAARRLQILNQLATNAAAPSGRELLSQALKILAGSEDVLFAAAYLLHANESRAALVATTAIEAGSLVAPRELGLKPTDIWPLHQTIATRAPAVLADVHTRFRAQSIGPDALAPEIAVLHPLNGASEADIAGVLILGVRPRLPLDAEYREFLTAVGETISSKLAESLGRRHERERLRRFAELDRAKTEFYSNVSHEFRTPLTLMLAPLEDLLLAEDALPLFRKQDIELILRNARRLLRLVGTLLDFSQLEAGRLRAQFVPTNLTALTRDIAAQFESAASRAGLALRLELTQLEDVCVDREMWEKIVSNLLSNALKFTFTGNIEVILAPQRNHAELIVRDSGVGMPREELPFVFRRFHRVRGTRARTHEGAGIGLALVHDLVRLHHGRVRVSSEPDIGTTFTVWIPLRRRRAHEDEPAANAPNEPKIAAALAEEASRWDIDGEAEVAASVLSEDDATPSHLVERYAPGARVLVVDDSADMRGYLSRVLAAHWNVEAVGTGNQALERARESRPELIVADVMLPGLDGFQLLAAIRKDEALQSIPVVLITARAGEEAAIEGLLAGADDYIVKPFTARELAARLGAQIQLARVRGRADAVVRASEARHTFLLRLSDVLRPLTDPDAIRAESARLLREHLDADGALYAKADEVANGAAPIATWIEHTLRTGERLIQRDAPTEQDAQPVRAGLAVPLVKDGKPIASMVVYCAAPREWTELETALVAETAARTWDAMERAVVEHALRESERRYRLLFENVGEGFALAEMSSDEQGRPIDWRYPEVNEAWVQTGVSARQTARQNGSRGKPGD